MRAARIHAYGAPGELWIDEVPRPRPRRGEILVEVHASSINPIDTKQRAGSMRGVLRYRLPLTLGFDLSGVVAEVGPGCTRLKVGDPVYASPHQRHVGTYADYALVDEHHAALKPTNLSHLEAAGIPLAGLTAWDCLEPLQPGQRALILAGSGGVGTLAIQLAKERGAHVITTCSARNTALVRGLGADEVIDYRTHDVRDVVRDVDLVLDAVGDWAPCREVLRRGGQLRSIVTGLPEATKRWGPNGGPLSVGLSMLVFTLSSLPSGIKVAYIVRRPSAENLAELTRRIEAGTLRPVIDRVFRLEEIGDAHRYSETGRARGKIVICVRGDPREVSAG